MSDTRAERAPDPDLPVALQEAERALREAAERWRKNADEQRARGGLSSMCGEEGIPSHVLSTARAISFEGAADTVAAALAAAAAPSGPDEQEGTLREVAEHALFEMRDRFDLKRGQSASLDALEDALPDSLKRAEDVLRRAKEHFTGAAPSGPDEDEAAMLAQTNATLRDLKANWREYIEEYTVDGDELMIDNILYWLIEDTSPPPSGEPPSEQEQP